MSNVEIAEDTYAAFAAGDIPRVLASMAPDIEWSEAEGIQAAESPYTPAEAGKGDTIKSVKEPPAATLKGNQRSA